MKILASLMAIIIGAVLAIPTWFYGAFIFHTLYGWFVKDIVGIDLSYMQCMGILVVIKFLKHPSSLTELDIRAIFEKHLTPAQSYFKMIIGYYGPVTLTFLIGCVIKIFV